MIDCKNGAGEKREKRLGAFPQLLSIRYTHILPMLYSVILTSSQCYRHILPMLSSVILTSFHPSTTESLARPSANSGGPGLRG